MKLFGSLKELVSAVFRKDSQEITLRPNQSTTYTAARDIQLPPGDANHVIVSASSTQTLTNKTIDADDNTISDIADGSIKAGAAINAAKIADGSVDNTEFQKLGAAGTAGAGNLVTTDGTQTLTSKTIDGDDNTVQDLPITSLKTALADADKVLRRDASGVPQSGNTIPNSSALVTTDASQTLTGKTIDGDNNTVQDLPDTALKTNLTNASKFFTRNASGVPESATKAVPTGAVVGDTDSQTLTNKTLTSPTINTPSVSAQVVSDYIDVNEAAAPSTPAASKARIYVKTDGRVYNKDDAGVEYGPFGSGSGGDTINTTPITGATTLTSTSANIRILTPASAFNLTLDNSFTAGFKFRFINNGSFEVELKANDGSQIATIYRNTSYEVVCTSSTPATQAAWEGLTPIISPWITTTVTGSWTTNMTHTGKYKRVGNMMHVQHYILGTGPVGTPGALTLTVPLSKSVDTGSLVYTATADRMYLSTGGSLDGNGAERFLTAVVYGTSTTSLLAYWHDDAAGGVGRLAITHSAIPFSFTTNDKILFNYAIPISGWSETRG